MKHLISPLLLATCLASSSVMSNAEQVKIPITQQAQAMQGIEIPVRGQSKQAVQTKFGQPKAMSKPVGEPPISSWTYKDFTVYFEYNHVIHAVLNHSQQK